MNSAGGMERLRNLYAAAVSQHGAGRFAESERLCREILREAPGHPDALHLLGLLAGHADRPEMAIQLIRQAIAANPGNPDYHTNLGLLLELSGRLEEAVAASQAALALDPRSSAALFNLGNELKGLGRLREAITAYRQALRVDAGSATLHSNLGAALAAAGEPAPAIDAYRTAIDIGPEQAEMHSNLGNALLAAGRAEAAIDAYRRAIAMQPALGDAHTNLAAALLETGDAAGALTAVNDALAVEPINRTALALKGIAQDQTGDHEGAHVLVDFGRFVQEFTPRVPDGYTGLEAYDSALCRHVRAHPSLVYEPTSRSTRHGRQTRNLLTEPKGPVAALEEQIHATVREYLERLPVDPSHPFLSYRPQRWRLNVWATVLEEAGHQLPHIHPAGWISGVYYAAASGIGGPADQAGWIEFGAPPDKLRGKASPSTHRLEPREGRMILFPSYLYHRTLPYSGGGTRVSIAFDVLPDDEPRGTLAPTGDRTLLERARVLHGELRHAEAETAIAGFLTANPRDADGWQLRGKIAEGSARYEDAVGFLERACEIAPDDWRHQLERGRALRHLERFDEAVAAYRRALELAPDRPTSHVSLATLFTDLGRFDEARASYEAALALNPAYGPAHYGLAYLKRFAPDDPQIAMLERAIAMEGVPDADRSGLHFALGRAYDHTGDYPRAFQQFTAGNRIKRTQQPFDRRAERNNARKIISAFTPDVFAAAAGAGCPSDLPVFVVGMPRSGTTLTEQILDSHPDVHGAGELNALWRTISRIGPYLPAGKELPEAVAEVQPEGWRWLGEAYVESIRRLAPGALRIVDKMPYNYTLLGLVKLMLPNARIVHCRRDPLDTCLSCYCTSFAGDRGFTNDLDDLGETYIAYRELMAHWRNVLPGGLLEIDYEQVVADVGSEARRLVAFLGLEWSEACLAPQENRRAVVTASHVQVRQPAYGTSVGRWRHYEQQLAPLRRLLSTDAD